MTFLMQFPVFAVTQGEEIALVLRTDTQRYAVAIFTDEAAAQLFRDQHHPGWRLDKLLSTSHLAQLLLVMSEGRSDITSVAFDPYRTGMWTRTMTIEEYVKQVKKEEESMR